MYINYSILCNSFLHNPTDRQQFGLKGEIEEILPFHLGEKSEKNSYHLKNKRHNKFPYVLCLEPTKHKGNRYVHYSFYHF